MFFPFLLHVGGVFTGADELFPFSVQETLTHVTWCAPMTTPTKKLTKPTEKVAVESCINSLAPFSSRLILLNFFFLAFNIQIKRLPKDTFCHFPLKKYSGKTVQTPGYILCAHCILACYLTASNHSNKTDALHYLNG